MLPRRPVARHPDAADSAQFFEVLVGCAESLKAAVASEVLVPEGLTWTSWQVLASLDSDGEQELYELAVATGLPKTTASYAVQRLLDRGLATRATHPADGRRVILSVTHQGTSAARRIARRMVGSRFRAVARLSSDDLAVLRAGLREGTDGVTLPVRLVGHV